MNDTDIIKKGNRLYSAMAGDMYLKVMAVEEKYVMARFKGCAPFVLSVAEFSCRYASYEFTKKPDWD